MAVDGFAGRGGVAVEPLGEVGEFDLVLDANVGDADLYDALLEAGNPVAAAKGGQALGDGFVKGFSSDFDCVGDAFEVLDGDAAGTSSHGEEVIRFAFYSP